MKVFQDEEYLTYKETCLAMGLLEDDEEWIFSLEEVSISGSAKQLRSTFAVILQYCRPTEPRKLLDRFLESMSDDFIYQNAKEDNCLRDRVNDEDILNRVLMDLDEELNQMGGSLGDFQDMPQPKPLSEEQKEARILREELFDTTKQIRFVNS